MQRCPNPSVRYRKLVTLIALAQLLGGRDWPASWRRP